MGLPMRWLVLLLVAPALAGCLLPGEEPGQGTGASTTTTRPLVVPPANGSTGEGGQVGPGTGADANGNQSEAPVFERVWPEPGVATIRPGAALDDGSCTANFVFTSLDNQSVYLGTAAHCFSSDINTQTNGCIANIAPLGAKMRVAGADDPAILVYSSWQSMQARNETSSLCGDNDFALLQLSEADEAKVSPAMWRYGGPTGVAGARDVGTLDRVLSYGNSGTRPQDSALSPREGYVTLPGTGCGTRVMFPNPAIPGDSGSPVILADGLALGVFVSIELTPIPGQGHVCLLDTMLSHAADAGVHVQLATWDVLDDGLLPP